MSFSTEELITAVLTRPPLWDSGDPNHSNRQVVKELWEEIKDLSGFSNVEIIKKRWKNIKDHYRKELRKILPTRSGPPGVYYQSQWKHFYQMAFMRDQILPSRNESKAITNFSSDSDDNENTQDSFQGESSDVLSPCFSGMSPIPAPSPSSSQSVSRRGRKRKSANDLRSEFLELEKKKILIYEAKKKTDETQDYQKSEDYHYLMSLLPQMEKFTSLQKFRVRNKINSIIMSELQEESIQQQQLN